MHEKTCNLDRLCSIDSHRAARVEHEKSGRQKKSKNASQTLGDRTNVTKVAVSLPKAEKKFLSITSIGWRELF